MINPNIEHRKLCDVKNNGTIAIYNGKAYPIFYRHDSKPKKDGKRYISFRFSIMLDQYVAKPWTR